MISKEEIEKIKKELTFVGEKIINNIDDVELGDYIIAVFVSDDGKTTEIREGIVQRKYSHELIYRPKTWERASYSLFTSYLQDQGKTKLINVIKPRDNPEYFL